MGNCTSNQKNALSRADIEKMEEAFKKLNLTSFYKDLDSLRSSIDGQIILPVPDQYELYQEARTRPYNPEFRGFPLIINRPKTTKDVSTIVKFVQEKCQKYTPVCIQVI